MLSLSNVTPEMAINYFEDDDYYSEEAKGKVEVSGQIKDILNLGKEIDTSTFANLLYGYSPDGKEKLISTKRKPLSDKDLTDLFSKFETKTRSLAIPEKHITFIKSTLEEEFRKTDHNGFHLNFESKKVVSATVKSFLRACNIEAKTKIKFSKACEQLITSVSKTDRRAGLDATFSAPKSVSIAALVGGDKSLIESHNNAVDYALSYLEKNCAAYLKGERRVRELSGNILSAKFRHGTSRAGDPQLHTHCVIFNMTKTDKGEWRSLANDFVYKQSKLLGCIYQNKLAELVQKQGYEIIVNADGSFDLEGYNREQLMTFSKRRQEVEENSAKIIYEENVKDSLNEFGVKHRLWNENGKTIIQAKDSQQNLKEYGFSLGKTVGEYIEINGFAGERSFENLREKIIKEDVNQKINRRGVLRDRKVKTEIKREDLERRWQGEAKEIAMTHPSKDGRKFIWGESLDENYAVDHLSERKAVFKEYDLKLQTLMKNLGRASFENIIEKLRKSRVVELSDTGSADKKLSSIKQLNDEKECIHLALSGRGQFKPIASFEVAEEIAQRRGYTSGQKQALALSLTTKDQFHMWSGVAGSGKSYALSDLRELAENDDYRVVSLAPDASSAKQLGESIGSVSSTVDSFLSRKSDGYKKNFLIIDEAGKLSTQKAFRLLNKAKMDGSRVLFVGDVRQFGSVEAGNPFLAFYKEKDLAQANLSEHRRQKDRRLKTAVELASMPSEAQRKLSLKVLNEDVIIRKSRSARINNVLKTYIKLTPYERQETAIIVDKNKDRLELTERLRESLQKEGSLAKDERNLPVFKEKGLTQAQYQDIRNYEVGDIIIPAQTGKDLIAHNKYKVKSIQNGFLNIQGGESLSPHTFQEISVFREDKIKVAVGDLVRWRRNHEGRTNGEEALITGVEKDFVTLKNLKDGGKETLPLNMPQHIDYAWILTSYSSQGLSKDRVISMMDSSVSRQSWYVTLSRAKHSVKVITDDVDALKTRILRDQSQENALDYLKPKEKWVEAFNEKISSIKFRSPKVEIAHEKPLGKAQDMGIEI